MKIVYVLNSGSPGGVEQHVLDLVDEMIARGHEVFVVCPWGEMVDKYFTAGAQVRVDGPGLDIGPFYIFRLIRFLKTVKPDVFHVHMLKTTVNGLIAVRLYRFWKRLANSSKLSFKARSQSLAFSLACPIAVAHVHTPLPLWQIPKWKKKLNIFVNRIITNWGADVVLALTKATKKVRVEGEGIDEEKIAVIPNGINWENIKFQISNNKKSYRKEIGVSEDAVLIGTLSRLTVEKGVETLVGALPILFEKLEIINKNIRILIGGSGKLEDSLKERVRDLGVEDAVTFLGFVPEEDKFSYLSSLDVFVFPSFAEGFGIALIEAMACGTCCLSSDLPVLQEVGGEGVETFNCGNKKSLADKLEFLIAHPEKRSLLVDQAQQRVESQFTLEKFGERYEKLYQRLLI